MKADYIYSPNACVFKKSYGDVHLTVIFEEPGETKTGQESAQMLKDEIHNFLSDLELEEIFRKNDKSRQD